MNEQPHSEASTVGGLRRQLLFREVNRQIVRLQDDLSAGADDRLLGLLCECTDAACAAQLEITPHEYRRVRLDAACFLVVPAHVRPGAEQRIVERHHHYVVVAAPEPAPTRAELGGGADDIRTAELAPGCIEGAHRHRLRGRAERDGRL